jgi:hypothetical protein
VVCVRRSSCFLTSIVVFLFYARPIFVSHCVLSFPSLSHQYAVDLPAARTTQTPLRGALRIVPIVLVEQRRKRWVEAIQKQTHFPLSELVPTPLCPGRCFKLVHGTAGQRDVARQFDMASLPAVPSVASPRGALPSFCFFSPLLRTITCFLFVPASFLSVPVVLLLQIGALLLPPGNSWAGRFYFPFISDSYSII